jgi:hypothetical protein
MCAVKDLKGSIDPPCCEFSMKYFRSFTAHVFLLANLMVDIYFAWEIVSGEDGLPWLDVRVNNFFILFDIK